MKTLRPDIKTNRQLKKAVLSAAKTNHIWINAFSLVNPSDKTLIGIGKAVAELLADRENLLPSYVGKETDKVDDLSRLTPCLYLHINAS